MKTFEIFETYQWLWQTKIKNELQKFIQKNPDFEMFEAKLNEFISLEGEVSLIKSDYQLGGFNFNCDDVKDQIKKRISILKDAYAKEYVQRGGSMEDLLMKKKTDESKKELEEAVKDFSQKFKNDQQFLETMAAHEANNQIKQIFEQFQSIEKKYNFLNAKE